MYQKPSGIWWTCITIHGGQKTDTITKPIGSFQPHMGTIHMPRSQRRTRESKQVGGRRFPRKAHFLASSILNSPECSIWRSGNNGL
jgi:hypothetical protein